MSRFSSLVPSWDTSSRGYPDRTSRVERLMLDKHLAHCGVLQGPLRLAWIGLSRLHRMLAERALTGTLLIALLAGTAWLVL
jgi:hypothetical protein